VLASDAEREGSILPGLSPLFEESRREVANILLMRQSLTFALLLLAGAVTSVSQRPVHALTCTPQAGLRLNTATGQLYQISLNYGGSPQATAVNRTSLLAPTDVAIPGRFALFLVGGGWFCWISRAVQFGR
jgi:hypothetical protein